MAIHRVEIPKLGMTMQDAELVEWNSADGAFVEAGDAVLTIETEKTVWDVEAPASGYLKILVPVGTRAVIGHAVGVIADTQEELAGSGELPQQTPDAKEEAGEAAPGGPASAPATVAADTGSRVKISPVARRMAGEHGIDFSALKGTGPGGRIVRSDIERAIEEGRTVPAAAPRPSARAPGVQVIDGKQVKEIVPLKGMRRAIAEHMHRSLQVSAQHTSSGEWDMTELIKLRKQLVSGEADTRITFTDLLVSAIAKVLRTRPGINASISAEDIVLWEDINIGVAVAITEGLGGLVVPVIRNADRKGLREINGEVRAASEKARSGKLLPDDVTGGTFTLSNLGAVPGSTYGFTTPILNQPEAAILCTGPITDRAVVRDGQLAVRPIMTFSFTFDHRLIDGAQAVMFLADLGKAIENPGRLLL